MWQIDRVQGAGLDTSKQDNAGWRENKTHIIGMPRMNAAPNSEKVCQTFKHIR